MWYGGTYHTTDSNLTEALRLIPSVVGLVGHLSLSGSEDLSKAGAEIALQLGQPVVIVR